MHAGDAHTRAFGFSNKFFFMTKIAKKIIDKILEQVRIEEVVADCIGWYDDQQNRGGLKKKGVRYTAVCPFHDDRNMGNFMVYPRGNCYKCFACGAKGGAVDFLMSYEKLSYPDAIRWLGKKYKIDTDMQADNITLPPPRPVPPPLPTLELPMDMVHQREELGDDNLVKWIKSHPWEYIARKRIDKVLKEYHIGHSRNGMTIFWQIDEQQRLRTGKMMRYYPQSHLKFGHRDKESGYNFDFVHSSLSRRRKDTDPWPFPELYNPDKQEARPCIFGLHLLDAYGPNATVCLVESEKTAIIMAIQYGNHAQQVWMACGGLENISRDKLKPIMDRHRRIVLYPDRDGIEKWRIKLEQLHYDNITMSTDIVTKCWVPEDGPKADVADIIIRFVHNSRKLGDIQDVKEQMPQAKPLIEKLNLEIEHGKETEDQTIGSN